MFLTGAIKSRGISDVFVLCTDAELRLYRVANLLLEYRRHELRVHHCPFDDGDVLPFLQLTRLLQDLYNTLKRGSTPLVQ